MQLFERNAASAFVEDARQASIFRIRSADLKPSNASRLISAAVLSLYLSLPLLALRAREDASEAALSQERVIRDGIHLNEAITGDRGAIFPRACWMNFQAIVSKRIGSRYVSGRTRAWLKTKNPSSSDSDAG